MFTRRDAAGRGPKLFSRSKALQEDAEWQALQRRVSRSRRTYIANRLRHLAKRLSGRLWQALQNPLVIIPPLVLALLLGWQHYTYAGRDLSLPSTLNLLANSDFTQDNAGIPTGWQISATSTATDYQTGYGKGYTGSRSFMVTLGNHQAGDLTLFSPKIPVETGRTYLFKSYYEADAPFAFLVRYYAADGSSTLHLLRTYPGESGTWSTTSQAFKADSSIVAVQFAYRLYMNGHVQLNNPYLEPQQDVFVAPPVDTAVNLTPNPSLGAGAYDTPDDWSTYHTGSSTAAFSYQPDPGGNYVQISVAHYKNGQAKWQQTAQSVQPDQYYQLGLSYRSDVPVPVTAEYTLRSNQRQYETLDMLPPADDWTAATLRFQTVPGATSLHIALPLEQNGTVASRDYTLTDITKPGPPFWQQPMVSITFDDGWQQTYQNVTPLLKQYKYAATFYINPATIETAGFMTADELTGLSGAGNEIAAHGYEHDDLTAINGSALNYQLREGRDYLQRAGFPVSDAATPYGRSDAEVQWYARQYFITLRSQDSGINTRQNLDPYNLKVINVNAHTSPQDITTALQQAKSYYGWVIFSYHQVGTDTRGSDSLHVEHGSVIPASFEQQISLIHDSGIRVLPVAAAYATLEHQPDT